MKKLLKLALLSFGVVALWLTLAGATCGSGKSNNAKVAPKTMKCQSGKCGDSAK